MSLRFTTMRWRPLLIVACLVGLLIGAWSVEWAANDSGYMLLGYGRYTVETNLVIAVLSIALLVLLSHFVVQCAVWVAGMGHRRRMAGTKKLTRATLSWIEQDWKAAEKWGLQAAERLPHPLLPLVMAADSANRQGSQGRGDQHLQQAIMRMPKFGSMIELERARMALESGEWESCVGLLSGVSFGNKKEAARTRLRYMMSAYEQMGDWSQLVEMIPDVGRLRLSSNADFSRWRKSVVTGWFRQLVQRDTIATQDLERAAVVWKSMSEDDRQETELVQAYAEIHLLARDSRRANEFIWKVLKQRLDNELLEVYASLPPESTKTRLDRSIQLMKIYEADGSVLALVGQSYYDAGQSDKAIVHWEQSLRLKFDARIMKKLAQEYLSCGLNEKALALWSHPCWDLGGANDVMNLGDKSIRWQAEQQKELFDDRSA